VPPAPPPPDLSRAAPEPSPLLAAAPAPPAHKQVVEEVLRVLETTRPAPVAERAPEELRPAPAPPAPRRLPASLSIGRVVVEVVPPAASPAPARRAARPAPPLRSARASSLRFGLGMT
jgi:hypothetical protein